MAWTANFDPRALAELRKLDRVAQARLVRFLQERLTGDADPRQQGKALKGGKIPLWRYRVGSYRIISRIEDDSETVLVLRIAHRKEAYR